MSRRERKRAYRRLKRVRCDLRVAVRKRNHSHGEGVDRWERQVHLLTKRKRRAKRLFALLKQGAPKEAERHLKSTPEGTQSLIKGSGSYGGPTKDSKEGDYCRGQR